MKFDILYAPHLVAFSNVTHYKCNCCNSTELLAGATVVSLLRKCYVANSCNMGTCVDPQAITEVEIY